MCSRALSILFSTTVNAEGTPCAAEEKDGLMNHVGAGTKRMNPFCVACSTSFEVALLADAHSLTDITHTVPNHVLSRSTDRLAIVNLARRVQGPARADTPVSGTDQHACCIFPSPLRLVVSEKRTPF